MAQLNQVGRHATTINTDDNFTRIVYHNTQVVKFNHAKIVLNSNGWHTQTTKTRMNQAAAQYNLKYNVYQKDYTWYIDYNGQVLEFYDGITLDR